MGWSQSSNSFVCQYKASGGNGIIMSDIKIEIDSDSEVRSIGYRGVLEIVDGFGLR